MTLLIEEVLIASGHEVIKCIYSAVVTLGLYVEQDTVALIALLVGPTEYQNGRGVNWNHE